MFGRRRKKSEKSGAADTPEVAQQPTPVQEPDKPEDRHRAEGPWDASESVPEVARIDLGAIRVPVSQGLEVQVNVAQRTNQIIGVTLVQGNSALQVQPFAAPKSSGLWEEMRGELREQVVSQGGKVEDFDGPFGRELRAIVPVEGKTNEEGRQLGQRVRFIGVDGPRWVLRGVIRGEAAAKPEAMAGMEQVFQQIVVVRGDQPVPPRDLLEITVPPEIRQSMAEQQKRAAQAAQAEQNGQGGQGGQGGAQQQG
ncbi:hypothetical protein HNR23_001294 [Nocardiopsis mwathae]|uniref:DUF3710 domain-containing protein n=1 Tax=Nocardiopsis mwathae TaxID=1472723 RepID=A0A7W9YFI7_9ACTN|nr:hypothetical protein [Nocardiopsis mwathae]